jgi:hypothetical protein
MVFSAPSVALRAEPIGFRQARYRCSDETFRDPERLAEFDQASQ